MNSDYVPTTSATHGGNGGYPFLDAEGVVAKGPISRIEVRHGKVIDAVRVVYGSDGYGETHGGDGGNFVPWDVPQGDTIVRVEGRSGEVVDRLQFFTDKGHSSPVFGGGGGDPWSVSDPNGGALRTVQGRSAKVVDQLAFMFGAPYYLDSITYDQQALDEARKKAQPKVLNRQEYRAASEGYTANYQYTSEVTQSRELSFSSTVAFKFGMTLTEKVPGLSLEESTELSLSATASNTYTTAETHKDAWDFPVPVPANKKVVAFTTVKQYTATVPFTYDVVWYRNGDRSDVIRRQTYSGTYAGVLIGDVEHYVQESDNLPQQVTVSAH